jgi:hypothetical protein
MNKPTLDTKVGCKFMQHTDYQDVNAHPPLIFCYSIDRIVSKRPLQIPVLRPNYDKPDPSIGVSECEFSIDGTLLATKNGKQKQKTPLSCNDHPTRFFF